jgi:hypothetical protein
MSPLSAVACVSSTDCWAVGGQQATVDAEEQPLIMQWSSGIWSVMTTPSPGDVSSYLQGVACVNSSDCWAVGADNIATLIEHWNGVDWSVVTSPSAPAATEAQLSAVSCVSVDLCWAVGYYTTGYEEWYALLEEYTGSGWTVVSGPSPPSPMVQLDLSAVSCINADDCLLVGMYEPLSGGTLTLAEQWTGTTWAIVPSADAEGPTGFDALLGMTCAGASSCWAVGVAGPAELVEEWTGIQWVTVDSESPPITDDAVIGQAELSAVSCASSTDCWAVGQYSGEGMIQTFVEQLQGAGWLLGSGANSSEASQDSLSGVTCADATDCVAVGDDGATGSDFGPSALTEQLYQPPAWSTAGSPAGDVLYSDTCVGPDECWAVGTEANANGTLILENTGDGWGTVSSPSAGADANNDLYGVTCANPTDCWAVGDYQSPGDVAVRPLIEWYDGSTWSSVSSPAPGSSTWLFGVACASSTECWAVGEYVDTAINEYQPLILEYNGTAWAVALNDYGNSLDSVTCVSVNDCWAVGTLYDSSDQYQTLVYQYSGGQWSLSAAPNLGGADTYNALSSVTCTDAANCWAVGIADFVGEYNQGLVERYDGSGWALVPVAAAGLADDLYAVACAATDDCWAVGAYFSTGTSGAQTLVEQYTGASWNGASSPNPSSPAAFLQGVACDGSVNCWAVGQDGSSDTGYSTVIEQSVQPGAPPMVSSLTPAAGPVGGGQTVTVNGYDFPTDGSLTATLGGVSVTPSDVTPTSFSFTAPAGAGYVTLQASDAEGSSLEDANAGYVYAGLTSYQPLTPFRVLDTRSATCIQCGSGALLPGETATLQVTGYVDPTTRESVPAGATAVVLNVVAVAASGGSYLTVYPAGTGRPVASNLNFGPTNTANLVVVAVGQGGAEQIYNSLGSLDVVADVEGYFTGSSGSQGEFHAIQPLRVCDTRLGELANPCNDQGTQDLALGPGQTLKVDLAAVTSAQGDIPSDGTAEAAVLNLTAVAGSQGTYLSVYPTNPQGLCSTPSQVPPPSSTLNVNAATNQANRVFAQLGPASSGGPDTDVCVYNSQGTVDVILDANGWFGAGSAGAGTLFQVLGPTRICDTRAGTGTECSGDSLTAGGILSVQVTGAGGIPSGGVLAVIANLTAVDGSAGTYLTAYPGGGATPLASDLNVSAGNNLPNLAVVELPGSGSLDLYNSLGTIDAILDVAGWFQPPPP